jgi:hypothetical protein
LVKPKVRMLSAICRICFFEWVRAFFAQGRSASSGSISMVSSRMALLLSESTQPSAFVRYRKRWPLAMAML